MENEQEKLVLLSERVSISEEAKLNPTFLTVDVKLCDSSLNLNREGVTQEFIEQFVANANEHVCLPFYADVKNLLAENYKALGHLYNKTTRKFGTQMIGSMSEFYTETDDNGVVSLCGKIRIPKRDRDIIYRLVDLYEMGRFAVSTEVSYDPRECEITIDGKFIVASENSSLNGLCLVWTPACEDAYALDMVAEAADNSEEIVTEGEELTAERGETEPMEKENITAEVTEGTVTAETQEAENTVAEAEEAQKEAVAEEQPVKEEKDEAKDPEEEQKKEETVAESKEANAEVLEHSVDTHESVENWGGEPVHVFEYRERVIETMEDAQTLVAELDSRIAELEGIKEKYDAIIAEEQEKAIAEKREKAKAFAEKQGLDVNETAVAEAITNLDFAKIAELTMAQAQEEEPAQEEKPAITLASFVELDISEDKYGGLLSRRNK